MNNQESNNRARPELRTLVIHETEWNFVKQLANADCRSVSSYLRSLIRKQHQKVSKLAGLEAGQ